MQEILDLYNKYVEEGLLPIGHQGNQHQKTAVSTIAAELKIPRRKVYSIVAASVPKPVTEGLITEKRSDLCDAAGNVLKYWDKKRQPRMHPEEANWLPGSGKVTSVSTNIDHQGNVISQWISEKPEDVSNPETIKALIQEFLKEPYEIEIPEGPSKFDADVIPWFQIGDAHLGLLAHEAETGANFDLKIAERELCAAFSILFDECPPRERCVINDVGDFTHIENMAGVTEASKNPLDYDGRFPKMIGVYVRTMRFIIDSALKKFKYVDFLCSQGNHSRTNDVWMAVMMREIYAPTGRVNVLDNTAAFIPYRMGNTFVMVHHGDRTKPERLREVMCQDFRHDWGEAEFRYIDVGHLHHKMAIKEDAGCVLEMWNTLAGKDKWHTDSGYRAHQSITRVDRSKTYGEVGRRLLPIKEIRDVIARTYKLSTYAPPERRKVYTV